MLFWSLTSILTLLQFNEYMHLYNQTNHNFKNFLISHRICEINFWEKMTLFSFYLNFHTYIYIHTLLNILTFYSIIVTVVRRNTCKVIIYEDRNSWTNRNRSFSVFILSRGFYHYHCIYFITRVLAIMT